MKIQQRIAVSLLVLAISLGNAGCRWLDDFRAREQPQYLEQPDRPTLNPESEDYKGDDTHKTELQEKRTRVPSIDKLSTIPELPEYPGGI